MHDIDLISEGSVLIVDDTPANLLALRAVLSPIGVRLVEANSGHQAIAHAREEQFALILLDVQMPEIDGFETAKRIRATENGRDTPIIFLTAIHRDERYARTGYEVGAADYLLKPFDADVLRARVRSFVALYNQREDLRRRDVQVRTRERDAAVRRLVAFERIATAALESSNLDAFLQTLLHVFVDSVDSVDSAGILLREGDRLVARASLGLDDNAAAGFSERIGEGFAGTVAATREPLLLADAADSPLLRKPWVRALGVRGLLGVPLISNGEVLGVAHIGSLRTTDFTADERRLFAAVADRAASAADHVRARRRVEELLDAEKVARRAAEDAARRQKFLAEVSAVLASSLDIVTTLSRVAEMAASALADWCAIDGINEDRTIVRLAVASESEPTNGAARSIDESASIDVHEVIERRATVRATHGGASSLCIPLFRRQGCVGALTFVRGADRPYSDEEAALAEEVALRLAMAIENAELYRSARDAVQIREDFVSIASHELKTPLTSLKLQLSSTRKRLPEDRNVIMERLAIVDRQVDKITALVSQLLDVSRIAGGHIELEPQWIQLRQTVERVVERFTSSSPGSALTLRGDAPRAFVDPFRVEQIVTNLVANALKYGKGKPIEVELSSDSGTARITVRDQGIGISAEEQARIFGRFERAVSSRQYGGFGLGLWIARQVVEASGGHISVKSEPGQGAEFTVTLPLNMPHADGRTALDQTRSEAQQ